MSYNETYFVLALLELFEEHEIIDKQNFYQKYRIFS
jgi:hypothetical protein